ncbi:hypothetical protein [Pseudomonas sp. OIL-1]|uniref:hypothetical protein n=1 Tax=Pseudomonas sp. OIL-1 TaxID=2706126 RepID=UPI0013A7370F|nr:hypothetical protein [Pseudomonas sp. OIL-1]QIB50023.1 hypothetical protein G3M63_02435 [Pseudomonas sp. OIL-1]
MDHIGKTIKTLYLALSLICISPLLAHGKEHPDLAPPELNVNQSPNRNNYWTHDSRNVAVATQTGASMEASTMQDGAGLLATIYQQGAYNEALILQQGYGHRAQISQFGHDNQASIEQSGVNNSASIVQIGSEKSSSINQSGQLVDILVRQYR